MNMTEQRCWWMSVMNGTFKYNDILTTAINKALKMRYALKSFIHKNDTHQRKLRCRKNKCAPEMPKFKCPLSISINIVSLKPLMCEFAGSLWAACMYSRELSFENVKKKIQFTLHSIATSSGWQQLINQIA